RAFTTSVIAALVLFIPVRFELIPLVGPVGIVVDILSAVGIAVILGLRSFGFFGLRVAKIVAGAAFLVSLPFVVGFLHDYTTLSASLDAYAVSMLVCYSMTVRQKDDFDFSLIRKRTGDFDEEEPAAEPATAGPEAPAGEAVAAESGAHRGADAGSERVDS